MESVSCDVEVDKHRTLATLMLSSADSVSACFPIPHCASVQVSNGYI